MLNKTSFSSILQEAYRTGTPHGHEHAILREYLQCEILALLFELPESKDLAFIGGTSLRLLHNLDRFSEDLDFDFFGKTRTGIPIPSLCEILTQRGYESAYRKKKESGDAERGGALVFSNLLFPLGISPHHDQVLNIKIDYTQQINRGTEIRTLNRFGFAEQIITLPLEMLCARKIHALFSRKRLQPRDLYDLAWFFSRRIKPDLETLRKHANIKSFDVLLSQINTLYARHKINIDAYERDMLPFLIDPKNSKLIRLLPSLAASLLS